MKTFSLDELLALFSAADQPNIEKALQRVPNVAVYRNEETGRISIHALTPDPAQSLDDGADLIGTFMRPTSDSRTQRALDMIVQTGCSRYAAAKAVGISPSAVTRALARAVRPHCPCCGRALLISEK